MHGPLQQFSDFILQEGEATSSDRMSVGFIGAGQLAHALVKGFTAAGEATFFIVLNLTSLMTNYNPLAAVFNNAVTSPHTLHIQQGLQSGSIVMYMI